MTGLPPAGGCVTFKAIIKLTPNPTAKGIRIYKGKGIKFKQIIPVNDVKRCPKKIFFGCANGLSGYPYNKTMEDPKEAIKKTPSVVLYVRKVRTPIVNAEKKAAIDDFFILLLSKTNVTGPSFIN